MTKEFVDNHPGGKKLRDDNILIVNTLAELKISEQLNSDKWQRTEGV